MTWSELYYLMPQWQKWFWSIGSLLLGALLHWLEGA